MKCFFLLSDTFKFCSLKPRQFFKKNLFSPRCPQLFTQPSCPPFHSLLGSFMFFSCFYLTLMWFRSFSPLPFGHNSRELLLSHGDGGSTKCKIRQIVCEYERIPEMLLRKRKKKGIFCVFFSVGHKGKKTVKIHSLKLRTQKTKKNIAAEVFSFFLATRFVKIQFCFIQLQLWFLACSAFRGYFWVARHSA